MKKKTTTSRSKKFPDAKPVSIPMKFEDAVSGILKVKPESSADGKKRRRREEPEPKKKS